jgi:hypothetical protein
MANINELLDWALIPVVFIVKILFKGIFFVLRPIIRLFNPRSVIVSQEDPVPLDKDHHKKRKREDKP